MPDFPATKYASEGCTSVFNNGHAFQCTRNGREVLDTSIGEFIGMSAEQSTTYSLAQIEWHFAKQSDTIHANGTADGGSEHTHNGHRYPLEMQLLHFNQNKYRTLDDAIASGSKDALLALGVFFTVGTDDNAAAAKEFAKLTNLITKPLAGGTDGASVDIKGAFNDPNSKFDPNKVLPADKTYATYGGSLTTPACNPVVSWIVLTTPVPIANASLVQLQTMLHTESISSPLISKDGNARPTQPLNGRTVYRIDEKTSPCANSTSAHVNAEDDQANVDPRAAKHEPPVLFNLELDGHGVTFHFVVNEVLMCLFFGIAAQELTESVLPGGILYPPTKKAINPLVATFGGVLGPITVYFILLSIFHRAGAFDDK